jgi:DNA helicase-2/ATP-dependent DNA helicase PcrA
MSMEEAGVDSDRWSPRAIRSRIGRAKGRLIGPDELPEEPFDLLARQVREVYPAYEATLRRCNAFDFDDLLVRTVGLLEGADEVRERYGDRFLHVLVDEYQDTNHAQYRMVRALADTHRNLCVVGDDDQSIYGWRGADLRNILDFERDFPGAHVVRLERNYRSTEPILRVANAVIARNSARKPKRLRTERGAGEPVTAVRTADERAEAEWAVEEIRRLGERYSPGDVAVLYRTNAQSRPFEDVLRRERLPYRIVGGVRFYERREIRDVLAYLQLVVNPADEAAFMRAVGWPRRGVGSVTVERLLGSRRSDETLVAAARHASEVDAIPAAGARSLESFATVIEELGARQPESPASELVRDCLERFGIREALAGEEEGEERLANVEELLAAVEEFDRSELEEPGEDAGELELFLQHVVLASDIDRWDPERGSVSLMTLHNAKGLEFPVVFVAGLERGLFPLARAEESVEEYEEERRLFYVGVTRARDLLYLTHADRRWRAGSGGESEPSPFLDEIPEGAVERRWAGGRRRGAVRREVGPPAWRAGNASDAFAWRAGVEAAAGAGGRSLAGAGGTEDGELHYDFGDSQETLRLEPGERVVHPSFGEGTILDRSGAGRATKLTIEFDGAGTRKVMAAFAALRPA